ncbi:MAG: methionine aminotransferase [Saprospiraceae bacterium]
MKIPDSKLPFAGTNIFTKMSGLAFEVGAFNIAQGFPDFLCDPRLIMLVDTAMKNGWNQYAPMPGVLKLRERIAEKTFNLYNASYDPVNEVTIMPGATAGIYAAINALVHTGEEVIILEPCYDSYIPSIIMAGAKPVIYKMKFPDYAIDWDEVKNLITDRTRMIMINTPHNPTGSILKHNDMLALERIVKDTDIFVLSDEVYEHIIFDGEKHCSISAYPALAERGIMVASFGKTFHTTGWRLGYVLAPAEIMIEIRRVYQFIAFSASTPMQHAIAEYLLDKDTYLHLNAFFQAKRDKLRNLLKDSRFTLLPSRGSYFQCATYEKITDEHDADLAIRLTKEYKVATIPVSAFYHDHTDNKVLRFCFGKKDETFEKAAEILCKI